MIVKLKMDGKDKTLWVLTSCAPLFGNQIPVKGWLLPQKLTPFPHGCSMASILHQKYRGASLKLLTRSFLFSLPQNNDNEATL
jgi:hypothetical protein